VSDDFHIEVLPNGLTLLGRIMDDVSSVAMSMLLRCGSADDPPNIAGAGAVAAEWLQRGAAQRDNRALNDALDSLGVQHSSSAQSSHLQMSAAMLGRNLPAVLEIYADILTKPRLEDNTFGACRELIQQDLIALEDEPARKANMALREQFFPDPWGRCPYGSSETLAAMTPDILRGHVLSHVSPGGAIIALAGKFDWHETRDLLARLLSDWSGQAPAEPESGKPAGGAKHLAKDSAQTHIALAYPSVLQSHERYYAARIAEAVLSRGMGSRLFTEVREKRGLAYHISANYTSLRDFAGIFVYAGTRPTLAQQSLDVAVAEIGRLGEGISEDELIRAKTQIRSSLIMQSQSTSARASMMAGDWYHLGRLRSLAELSEKIQAVTNEDVMEYLHEYPPRQFSILTIGPEPLDTTGLALSGKGA
jgi:predicted Zn-dependent peptidase